MFETESFFSKNSFDNLWTPSAFVWTPLLELAKIVKERNSCKIEIEIPEGVFLQNPEQISIGKDTVIEPNVLIQGPCIIGRNCTIRHGAYIRGPFICGDYCHIGHAAEVKHSLFLDYAAATHFSYVGDSILGRDVNLGAGVKCANLRLDRKEIFIHHQNEKIPTGLKKFGAIVGDRSQIGCNCVLNPGTLVYPGHLSLPLTTLKGIKHPPLEKAYVS